MQVDCTGQVIVGEFDTVETLDLEDLERGYCNPYRNWIPGRPTYPSYFAHPQNATENGTPIVHLGNTTFYNPGVMENSAEMNGVDLSACIDGTSVMFGRPNGNHYPYLYAYVRHQGSDEPWLKLCVADSPGIEDQYHHVDEHHLGNVLEVGARAAAALGMITLSTDGLAIDTIYHYTIPIEVYFSNDAPPEGEIVRESYFRWWRNMVRFQVGNQAYSYDRIWEMNPIP